MLKDFLRLFRGRNEEERAIFDLINWDNIFYCFLSNVCNGIFNFENITKEEEDLLLTSIFKFNYIACYKNKNSNYIFCGATPLGEPNEYGLYKNYQLNLTNGNIKISSLNDNLIIGKLNTIVGVTYNDLCIEFSNLLSQNEKSILNSIILSRMTKVFTVENENDSEDLRTQINATLEIGKPYIIKKGTFSQGVTVTDISIEDTVKYFDVFRELINQFLSLIGLTSLVAPNKKERLITDEIKSNDDIKSTILSRQFDNLKNFIEEVNEKTNRNIEISINEKIDKQVEELKSTVERSLKND